MQQIYLFRNNLTKSWGKPVVSPEQPDTFFRQFHDAIFLDTQEAFKNNIHISTIYYVGQYDDSNGTFNIFQEDAQLFYNCQEAADQFRALQEVKKDA